MEPALLFNGASDVSLVHELTADIASADSIDAVVAFLKFSGLKLLRPAFTAFFARGGELRLIATTYMGASEKRAINELISLGGLVRIAYAVRSDKTDSINSRQEGEPAGAPPRPPIPRPKEATWL